MVCNGCLLYTSIQLLPREEFHFKSLGRHIAAVELLDYGLRLASHVAVSGSLFINGITEDVYKRQVWYVFLFRDVRVYKYVHIECTLTLDRRKES